MDQVDLALTEAWRAMLDRIQRDPDDLHRRRQRARKFAQRPVRPACLAIRASDTRLHK